MLNLFINDIRFVIKHFIINIYLCIKYFFFAKKLGFSITKICMII